MALPTAYSEENSSAGIKFPAFLHAIRGRENTIIMIAHVDFVEDEVNQVRRRRL
jgi:hypothetical protein